jgi:hypothetical protein
MVSAPERWVYVGELAKDRESYRAFVQEKEED